MVPVTRLDGVLGRRRTSSHSLAIPSTDRFHGAVVADGPPKQGCLFPTLLTSIFV